MQVGDIVVYDGAYYIDVCGKDYYYVEEFLSNGGVWLLQLSRNRAGWRLRLPQSDLKFVGRPKRLLKFGERNTIARTRMVSSNLRKLLQPWLGERQK